MGVARLLDVYESAEHFDLVMECLEGGELFHHIKDQKRFSEQDTAKVTWQMLLALSYLHESDITHGDVKLENWMYSSKERNHIKLIDFGFSKVRGQEFSTVSGSVAYVAPEALNRDSGTYGDMWSLGVIVFALLAGYFPFSGNQDEKLQAISKGACSWRQERWSTV